MYELLVAVGSSPYFEFANTPLEFPAYRFRGTAGTSVSSTDQRRVDTPCSWRIHPAGSGAEEEAIRTTPFGDVDSAGHVSDHDWPQMPVARMYAVTDPTCGG